MKLTARHKVGGVLCVLGVIAVGVDRLFVLPQEAAADGLPSEHYAVVRSTGTPVADPPEVPAGSISTARAAIADRLEQVAARRGFDLEHVPDAFAPPKSWLLVEDPDGPRTTRMTAAEFEATRALTGVMAVGDGGYAIIDGRMLFIGQELDGFELIAVSERAALLELDGVRVRLELSE
jgi:hypothetical protein